MTKVLVIASKFDDATNIISTWADSVYADERLIGVEVTRKNVEQKIKENDVVIIFSHALASNKVGGYNNKVILDDDNIGLLKDKKVFFITCRTTRLYSYNIFDTVLAFRGVFAFDVLYADIYKKLIVELANNFYKDNFCFQECLKKYLKELKVYPEFTRGIVEKDIGNLIIKQKINNIFMEISFYPSNV